MNNYKVTVVGLAAACLFSAAVSSASAPEQRVLVIISRGPEEVVSCAGAIRNAVDNGADVRLAIVNSDRQDGSERLERTIGAMSMLGVPKEKILFLGYDTEGPLLCAYDSKSDPLAICPGASSAQTHSPSSLMVDYHTLRFGAPGDYNRRNVLGDVSTIIGDFRPHDIFMPAHMEMQPDLAAVALFVKEAIIDLKRHAWYAPTLHEYVIYRPGLPQASLNALEPVSNVSAGMDETPYAWDNREALPVPEEMYAPLEDSTNLKQLAFRKYLGETERLTNYIKADEVFWPKDMSSLSYSATVSASSERADRPASAVIDGVALGAPFATEANFHDFAVNEWIANDASSGAFIRLSWDRPVPVNRVMLYDCPSAETQILSGELIFSDGLRLFIDALPNRGAPRLVEVPLRWTNWVKFKVSSFVGPAPGLSEFEVYAVPKAFPTQTVTRVRDTSVQVNVTFPDALASGNRLAWRVRGTEAWNYLEPDRHLRGGSYVFNGLQPNRTYDIVAFYEGPWGWPRHIKDTVTTAPPEPPPLPPECRNCLYEFAYATADSITVTVAYPDSNAWGNRLGYSDLTTGAGGDWGIPLEMHDGTYTITGLTPNNLYNINIVYYDATQAKPWIDNIYTAATLPE